mgnify:CR=1 FL=1
MKVSEQWLPVISFIVVFIVVVLLVRLGANFIQRSASGNAWMGQQVGRDHTLSCYLYRCIQSVLLFYAEQLQLLKQELSD